MACRRQAFHSCCLLSCCCWHLRLPGRLLGGAAAASGGSIGAAAGCRPPAGRPVLVAAPVQRRRVVWHATDAPTTHAVQPAKRVCVCEGVPWSWQPRAGCSACQRSSADREAVRPACRGRHKEQAGAADRGAERCTQTYSQRARPHPRKSDGTGNHCDVARKWQGPACTGCKPDACLTRGSSGACPGAPCSAAGSG